MWAPCRPAWGTPLTGSTPCRVPTSPPESQPGRTDAWARALGWDCRPQRLPCHPHRLYRQPYGALPSANWAWLKCPLGTARQADGHSLGRGCVLPTETVTPRDPELSDSHSSPSPTSASITSFPLPISFMGSLNSLYFFKCPLSVQATSMAWA